MFRMTWLQVFFCVYLQSYIFQIKSYSQTILPVTCQAPNDKSCVKEEWRMVVEKDVKGRTWITGWSIRRGCSSKPVHDEQYLELVKQIIFRNEKKYTEFFIFREMMVNIILILAMKTIATLLKIPNLVTTSSTYSLLLHLQNSSTCSFNIFKIFPFPH